jgi:hypothetical protein
VDLLGNAAPLNQGNVDGGTCDAVEATSVDSPAFALCSSCLDCDLNSLSCQDCKAIHKEIKVEESFQNIE